MTTLPLFPASIVGSIPRPLVVRELIEKPEWDAADRSAMDAACRFVVALQERAGLDVVKVTSIEARGVHVHQQPSH